MSASHPHDDGSARADGADGDEVAKPRFWGPASYWRLGLVALLVLIGLLAVFGT